MNELEQMFYDAFLFNADSPDNEACCQHNISPQVVIGIYKVDFVVDERFVIEIDGYDFHKTKEQRESDYKRERYLLRNGYITVRFTGTEVFLDAYQCATEAIKMIDEIAVSDDYKDAQSCFRFHEYMKEREAKKNEQRPCFPVL